MNFKTRESNVQCIQLQRLATAGHGVSQSSLVIGHYIHCIRTSGLRVRSEIPVWLRRIPVRRNRGAGNAAPPTPRSMREMQLNLNGVDATILDYRAGVYWGGVYAGIRRIPTSGVF